MLGCVVLSVVPTLGGEGGNPPRVPPYQGVCMAERIERALVVTAHPDDSEFGAGGTVAKLVKDGCEVTYVIVTNGNKGSGDRSMTPERLAAIRADEQRNAARTLGVARVEFLGHPDGEVEDTRDVRRDVAREIRKWRPD